MSDYCLKLCLLVLFFSTQITLQAQLERSNYNYNSKDGLNALHVYSIVQDSKGFMWIGTSTGLVQFDGVTFKTIELPGLKNPEILELKIDEDDNLWFANLFNQLCRYSPDHKLEIIELHQKRSFFNIWIKGDEVGVFDDVENGVTLNRKTLEFIDEQEQPFKIPCINDDLFITADLSRYYLHKNGDYKEILLNDNYETAVKSFFKFGDSFYAYTSERTKLLKLIEKENHYSFEALNIDQPFFINSISELSDSLIYINTRAGVHIYSKDFKNLKKIEFPNINVAESLIDNENNLWLSTFNSGLVFSNYSNILSKQALKDLSVTEILKYKESLYIGTVEGKVFLSNEEGVKLIHEDNGNFIRFLLELDGIIFIGTNTYIVAYEEGRKTQSHVSIRCFKDGIKIDDSMFIVGSCTGYAIVKISDKIGPEQMTSFPDSRVFCLHKIKNDSKVLISTIGGIHSLNINTKELTRNIFPDLAEYNFIDIEETESNELWLATSNSGVLLLKDGKIKRHYSTNNKLNSNFVNDIFLDDENKLWVSTASGINIIDIESEEVSYVSSKDGLSSNIVQRVLIEDEDVYVGTANGLDTYNRNNRFSNVSAPPIYINGVTVDGSSEKFYELDGQEKAFRFKFQGINYSSLGHFTYKYRLKGLTDNWEMVPSSINEAVYNKIPPGDYTFEVYAINEDGVESNEAATISFTMPRPIYSRWWFVLVTLCLLFGVITWIFINRVNQINKENELERNARSQQLIALKAQMKPHFISNILNSIQSHSMLQDPIRVNLYITRLSKFVRNVLKMSDAKVVSLKDEMDVLQTYLELEQMRADQAFGYRITVDQSINSKRFYIPPMLIQPYIENAIKHGALSVEDGLIQINIEKSIDDTILISIEDNGVGIENSLKRKDQSGDHISVGIDKNSQRIELLKTIHKKKFVVEVSDRTKDELGGRGTKVELLIANMSEIFKDS